MKEHKVNPEHVLCIKKTETDVTSEGPRVTLGSISLQVTCLRRIVEGPRAARSLEESCVRSPSGTVPQLDKGGWLPASRLSFFSAVTIAV